MNLKEAFRYQNRLQSHLEYAEEILGRDSNVLKTENTYLKSKAAPDAEDEVIVETPRSEYADRITYVAGFVMFLIDEKEKLFKAIRDAKRNLDVDIDSESSLNAARQNAARIFSHMVDLRNSETVTKNGGIGYRFNAEGNQTVYKCDVKTVTTINYDRNAVKKYLKQLDKKADAISAEIDRAVVNAEVGYECPFDVNDSFSEAFERYISLIEN